MLWTLLSAPTARPPAPHGPGSAPPRRQAPPAPRPSAAESPPSPSERHDAREARYDFADGAKGGLGILGTTWRGRRPWAKRERGRRRAGVRLPLHAVSLDRAATIRRFRIVQPEGRKATTTTSKRSSGSSCVPAITGPSCWSWTWADPRGFNPFRRSAPAPTRPPRGGARRRARIPDHDQPFGGVRPAVCVPIVLGLGGRSAGASPWSV